MRQILIKKNATEVAAEAAERFIEIARPTLASRGRFSVALSGGSTPRLLYTLLSSQYRDAIDWGNVRFFFGDERNVLPDASESNYRMARETLFEPLLIDDRSVVRWKTELADVNEAASEYHDELDQNGALDLVLLGLGADAHTASLFPRTAALGETNRLAVANWVEQLNGFRLTATFPAINSGENVLFLVAGEDKAQAVYNVLKGDFLPEAYPAQLVLPVSSKLCWLLDDAAASKL